MLVLMTLGSAMFAANGWSDGRATFYGAGDGYSIHKGSCLKGTINYPYHVTALNTGASGKYPHHKCGECYEVKCFDGPTRGNDWSRFPGPSACKNENVIKVEVTDSCPCNHPNPSNHKWCCGDKFHFDLSWAAFEKIAQKSMGVIDVKYRHVGC